MAGNPDEALGRVDWAIPLYVIHAEKDEVFPVAITKKVVETIQTTGVHVTLDVLPGVTHFETHRFVEPLRNTVAWLRWVWQSAS